MVLAPRESRSGWPETARLLPIARFSPRVAPLEDALNLGRAIKSSLFGLMMLAWAPLAGHGQSVSIKRTLPEPTPPLCPPTPPVSVSPTVADRAEADRLLARATQLMLLGDSEAGLNLLRQAEQLNPASPDVAYRLGAAERDMGQEGEAVIYYCRYLTLAPGAEDGDDVRELVSQLVPPPQPLYDSEAASRFHDGVDAWDGGDVPGAAEAFLDVVQMAPNLPEAVYNRGLVAAYQDRDAQAAADLRRYVELRPSASDRDLVEDWLTYLNSPVEYVNPTKVLAGGLVVPGMGQLMTGSQVPGLSLMGAGVVALAAGALVKTVDVQCLSIPVNGECPPDQIKSEEESRNFLIPGIAAYGGLAVVGAVLAYRQTKENNTFVQGGQRFQPRPGSRSGTDVEVEGPAFHASGDRVGVTWLRLTF